MKSWVLVTASNLLLHILIFTIFQLNSINNPTPFVSSFFSPYFLHNNLLRSAFIYMRTVNLEEKTKWHLRWPPVWPQRRGDHRQNAQWKGAVNQSAN
jgi:hypothetical protein